MTDEWEGYIECPDCDGNGIIWNNNDASSGQSCQCEECDGEGWRAPTQAEYDELCELAETAAKDNADDEGDHRYQSWKDDQMERDL